MQATMVFLTRPKLKVSVKIDSLFLKYGALYPVKTYNPTSVLRPLPDSLQKIVTGLFPRPGLLGHASLNLLASTLEININRESKVSARMSSLESS